MENNPANEKEQTQLKDEAHLSDYQQKLDEAVANADIASIISVLHDDLIYWANSLKRVACWIFDNYKDSSLFYEDKFSPDWLCRDFIGMQEVYEIVEFHKGIEYATSFGKEFDNLLLLKKNLIYSISSYTATLENSGFAVFKCDIKRMIVKIKEEACMLAKRLRLLKSNFTQTTNMVPCNPKLPKNKAPCETSTTTTTEMPEKSPYIVIVGKGVCNMGVSVKLLKQIIDDNKREGVKCEARTWKSFKKFFGKKLRYSEMIKQFKWENGKLHTEIPVGKVFMCEK